MNDILDELWDIKDTVSKQYDNDLDSYVKELKKKVVEKKRRIVNLSSTSKKTV